MRRVALALVLFSAAALAAEKRAPIAPVRSAAAIADDSRPSDAVTVDRHATDDDAQDRKRRRESLREQSDAHRALLRDRLRALYKMSNGGAVRMLLSANNVNELSSRSWFVRRLLERDLQELKALNEEMADLQAEVSGVKPNYQVIGNGSTAGDFARGHVARPVNSRVLASFGPSRDEDLQIDFTRRGVEFKSQPKELVHAPASGTVTWIGDIPGVGRGVAIDHGGGFISLTGKLTNLATGINETVRRGDPIGEATSKTLYFEVSQAGTAFDPVPWLEKIHKSRN